jgi:hypothetical protein
VSIEDTQGSSTAACFSNGDRSRPGLGLDGLVSDYFSPHNKKSRQGVKPFLVQFRIFFLAFGRERKKDTLSG